jgi:DNA-binding CsgD family transcriptional regulator
MLFWWMRARVDVLWRGDHDAIPELELIVQEPTLGPHLDQARSDLALALGYAARFPDARRVLEDGLAQAGSARGAAILRMIESEVEFEAGRFERAYEAAQETLAGAPGVMTGGFALLYRAWACMETGRPVPADSLAGPAPPLLAPAEVEIEALRALQDPSRAAEAEALFDESARGWESGLVHRELRARWGAAEAARRAGESERAVERLLALEERVEAMALPGFAGRVRRSLREAGVARASASDGDGLLSAREREVMELVSQGLTSREIAQRLGVSRSTVETQVTSAMRKLKASTRKQAASLAAALD